MILDLNRADDTPRFEADLCIVGGGMAGLTVARALLDTRLVTCVVESGGLEPDRAVEMLNQVGNDGPLALDLATTRPRILGGSTSAWGGWCCPLDDCDFVGRP